MPHEPATVTRTVHLAADPERVLAALTDPSLLSGWLGPWTAGIDDPTTARVTTDDGVTRQVRGLRSSASGVTWQWRPLAADRAGAPLSEVRLTVDADPAGGSTLTITEVGRGGIVALDGFGWAVATLALEVALAAHALARV